MSSTKCCSTKPGSFHFGSTLILFPPSLSWQHYRLGICWYFGRVLQKQNCEKWDEQACLGLISFHWKHQTAIWTISLFAANRETQMLSNTDDAKESFLRQNTDVSSWQRGGMRDGLIRGRPMLQKAWENFRHHDITRPTSSARTREAGK